MRKAGTIKGVAQMFYATLKSQRTLMEAINFARDACPDMDELDVTALYMGHLSPAFSEDGNTIHIDYDQELLR